MQPKAVARVGCWLVIATCAGVSLLAAGPYVRAWWETERAGSRLNAVLKEAGEQDALPCEMVIGQTPSARHAFDDVVGAIERSAVRTAPALRDRLDFLLAQAMCLNREAERAIPLLHELAAARPNEPLRHIALAFAYAGLAETCATPGMCDPEVGAPQAEALASIVEGELKPVGSSGAEVAEDASKAALDGRFDTADRYYRLARAAANTLTAGDQFLWTLCQLVLSPSLAMDPGSAGITVHELTDDLVVAGTELIWLQPGAPLGNHLDRYPRGLSGEGIMWFNGAAMIVVRLPVAGTYELSVGVLDNPPSPTHLQLEYDMRRVGGFSLVSGDGGIRETRLTIELEEGVHILGVRYLNEAMVGGRDRNAVIVAVGVQRVAP